MKIISPFKDYYDRVALQYGGGDPKVVYIRNKIAPDHVDHTGQASASYTDMGFPRNYPLPGVPSHTDFGTGDKKTLTSYQLVVVAGRGFYICKRESATDSRGYRDLIQDWHICRNDDLPKRRGEDVSPWIENHGQHRQRLVQLCKDVGHPVFLLGYRPPAYYGASFYNRVPNLGDLGFQAVYGAEQVYQDLAMFIGNVLTENPDMMPTTPQTDIQKAEAHGFDKRQSFRHRK